ncbi:thermonuclease family protein [Nocardioides sp. TF02-7]|uniref:thermonuclease family protein n=1 Tax=Nocardioides sp. TF02-7 TaxID=2917724 RepID=UPI001F0639B1|nr:thermonuclease family protein [Nocardioides sp. TF02-7]UMG93549.1 thermonuclease family protein [Nocardioides sp. TF02-7]
MSAFLVLTTLIPAGAPAHAQVADRDCSDFATQAAAQRFYLNHGGPHRDPHRLDADGDGRACDSNPCPCSNDTGGGHDNGSNGGNGGNQAPNDKRRWAKVVRVIDGDTVVVKLVRGPKVRVRLLGIDTPEVSGRAECGGRQATASARTLMPRGKRVLLLRDGTQRNTDRYGRLLRYVMRNGKDVSRAQVAQGVGHGLRRRPAVQAGRGLPHLPADRPQPGPRHLGHVLTCRH